MSARAWSLYPLTNVLLQLNLVWNNFSFIRKFLNRTNYSRHNFCNLFNKFSLENWNELQQRRLNVYWANEWKSSLKVYECRDKEQTSPSSSSFFIRHICLLVWFIRKRQRTTSSTSTVIRNGLYDKQVQTSYVLNLVSSKKARLSPSTSAACIPLVHSHPDLNAMTQRNVSGMDYLN